MRTLSRELADEFSNLLTGVLGHASLAAAELDGNTSREISEIEKSAREAAHWCVNFLHWADRGGTCMSALSPIFAVCKKLPNGSLENARRLCCVMKAAANAEANSLRIVLKRFPSPCGRTSCDKRPRLLHTVVHGNTGVCFAFI
ncbi:MAG: hypothetical protein IPP40_06350 [bacterium]|nr:hypothetical protein [bacterium]